MKMEIAICLTMKIGTATILNYEKLELQVCSAKKVEIARLLTHENRKCKYA